MQYANSGRLNNEATSHPWFLTARLARRSRGLKLERDLVEDHAAAAVVEGLEGQLGRLARRGHVVHPVGPAAREGGPVAAAGLGLGHEQHVVDVDVHGLGAAAARGVRVDGVAQLVDGAGRGVWHRLLDGALAAAAHVQCLAAAVRVAGGGAVAVRDVLAPVHVARSDRPPRRHRYKYRPQRRGR